MVNGKETTTWNKVSPAAMIRMAAVMAHRIGRDNRQAVTKDQPIRKIGIAIPAGIITIATPADIRVDRAIVARSMDARWLTDTMETKGRSMASLTDRAAADNIEASMNNTILAKVT